MQYRKSQEQSCQRQAHKAHAEQRYQPSRGRRSAMHVKASTVNALVVPLTATCDACEAALVAVRSEPKGPKGTPSKWLKGGREPKREYPLLVLLAPKSTGACAVAIFSLCRRFSRGDGKAGDCGTAVNGPFARTHRWVRQVGLPKSSEKRKNCHRAGRNRRNRRKFEKNAIRNAVESIDSAIAPAISTAKPHK